MAIKETTPQPETASPTTLAAATSLSPITSTVQADSTTTTETPTTNKAMEEIVTLIHRFVINKRKSKARRPTRRPGTNKFQ